MEVSNEPIQQPLSPERRENSPALRFFRGSDSEIVTVLRFCNLLAKEKSELKSQLGIRRLKILDIGCGYGRFALPLIGAGHEYLGIEANPDIVAANRKNGINCVTNGEFEGRSAQLSTAAETSDYDVILMAHVIEHFQHQDLVQFMDKFLDLLPSGCHLLILTPLMSSHFYDDFDHVKPYQPAGLNLVFCRTDSQVQYRSRNRLVPVDLWYRRSPITFSHLKAKNMRTSLTPFVRGLEVLLVLAHRLSFGLIGTTDGWAGLYKKI